MSIYLGQLTTLGKLKSASAYGSGQKLTLVQFGLCDGNGVVDLDDTALENEVYRGDVEYLNVSVNSPDKPMVVSHVATDALETFTLTKIGLFDEDGDLIVISALPNIETGLTEFMIKTSFIVKNATEVMTVTIDTATMKASHDYVDLKIKELEEKLSGSRIAALWRHK